MYWALKGGGGGGKTACWNPSSTILLEKRNDVHSCFTLCEVFLGEKRPQYCKISLLQPLKLAGSKDSQNLTEGMFPTSCMHKCLENGLSLLNMKMMKEGKACFMQQLKQIFVPLSSVNVKWTSLWRGLKHLHVHVHSKTFLVWEELEKPKCLI